MSMDERQKYEADVAFEVWMRGGNPDNIDPDRVEDMREMNYEVCEASFVEWSKQQPRPAAGADKEGA